MILHFPLHHSKVRARWTTLMRLPWKRVLSKIVDLIFDIDANSLFEYLKLIMDELNVPDTSNYVCFTIQLLSDEGLKLERAQIRSIGGHTTYLFNRGDKSHAFTIHE